MCRYLNHEARPSHRVLPAHILLRRPALVAPWARIQQAVGLPDVYFRELYLATLTSLLDHVQLLSLPSPTTSSTQIAFVDHAVARAARALTLARGQLLPHGRGTEDAKGRSHVWHYSLFAAQLLRGVEQVALGQAIYHWRRWGKPRPWDPLDSPLRSTWATRWYCAAERLPPPPAAAALRIAERIMPERGLAWLAADADAYAAWVGARCEESMASSTEARPLQPVSAKDSALAVDTTAAKAPSSPHPLTQPTGARQRAHAFLAWLTRAIADGTLSVDKADSLLFRVPDNALALRTPQTFQRYAAETGADWKAVQQAVLKLGVHRHESGSNFTQFNVHDRTYTVVIMPIAPALPRLNTSISE